MNDSLAIRKGVFLALDENITLNSEIVAVYDAFEIPDGVSYPYILLSSQSSSQRVTKGRRPQDAEITIDIVTGFRSPEGREQSEDIADQINELINPDDRSNLDLSAYGYKMGDINIRRSYDVTDKNDIYYVYRKIVVYSLIISKI